MLRQLLLFVLALLFIGTLKYQEKTLDFYLSQGIAYNPLLKDLRNRVRANSADSLLIRARKFPSVSF
jgi:hypothetical protein